MNHTTPKMTKSEDVKYNHEEKRIRTKMKLEKEENVMDKVFVCNICGKNFYKKSNLIEHVNSHDLNSSNSGMEEETQNEEKERQNTCNICYKKFTAKKNVLKHLREVHKNYKEAERMMVKKLKCPERNCDFICRMMKELRSHIEKEHNVKILKDTLQFPNETDFLKWKKEEETNTVSWFVTGRKKTTLTDGTKKQTLCCHRTGQYNPKGFGKYRMRSVGSCKIGVTCPAAMEITEYPEGPITVVYYKTHVGHMQDVVYLKLSREERAHLAEKIEQGFTFDAILEDVKESSHSKDATKKRIQLLSKKDLYSIMRTANSTNGKKSKKEFNEDNKSVELREGKQINTGREASVLENSKTAEGSVAQNFTFYPSQSVILPQHHSGVDGHSPLKLQRESNIPQTSGEGVASQIVILSPDIDYTSVAEIILLPSNETQSAMMPQKMIKMEEWPCKKTEVQHPAEMSVEEKNKINKTNLEVKLKTKMETILEFLPKSEFLTPKQFDLINAKLDGIVDIFNSVNAKSRTRRQQKKKMVVEKRSVDWQGGEETKSFNQVEEVVLRHPVYESPLVYAVYN